MANVSVQFLSLAIRVNRVEKLLSLKRFFCLIIWWCLFPRDIYLCFAKGKQFCNTMGHRVGLFYVLYLISHHHAKINAPCTQLQKQRTKAFYFVLLIHVYVSSPSELSMGYFQGRIISVCDDGEQNTIHLWEVNKKEGKSVLEEVKTCTLEGR